jgi:hypothetical protein
MAAGAFAGAAFASFPCAKQSALTKKQQTMINISFLISHLRFVSIIAGLAAETSEFCCWKVREGPLINPNA